VGRPAWGEGEEFWRGGYESLASEDRITVVPAAWRDAVWWQEEQARNLPAILRELKRDYNVDDNRVTLTGVSDGGTGAYFFAFKQPTPWAAFLPYIGNAAVLRNPQSGGGYRLYFENLRDKPLYIVNGENDPLYPASSIQPFVDVLEEAKVNYQFTVIENGGHNLNWMREYAERIEYFKRAYPRDALPDVLQWVADRTDVYNRNHWLILDERTGFGRPAVITATREQNRFTVDTSGVDSFTLLLSPSEIDFEAPITVVVNGEEKVSKRVDESLATLLKWAARDMDRLMLFTAELTVDIAE
jgi:dienelactone hydrolase